MLLTRRYSYIARSHQRVLPSLLHNSHYRSYSIDTPPEELQKNVIELQKNIDMKNLTLQSAGGRSSVSGIRATVFGASSLIGRHVTNQLGQMGSQVVIPYRSYDAMELRDYGLMGDLGQIVPLPYQIRDKRSVERVIQDSNVVINCISRRRETRNFSFHDTHVNATHMIARTAAELGVDRFIQVSVANAQEDSPSAMHRTKWHGEQVAKAFYPECTILRPGVCYGYGDQFFENIAWRWHYGVIRRPSICAGHQKIQPIHYLDVARAVMVCLLDPVGTSGKTYELFGNTMATKDQFWGRIHDVLQCQKTPYRIHRDWNPQFLAAILKPFYPIHWRIQHWFDFMRCFQYMQFLSYECVQQANIDMYMDEKRLYDDKVGTLEDLGLVPEDYFYWEAKLLEKFFDRMVPPMEQIEMRRTQSSYGGPVPTTEFMSFHSVAHYSYRHIRKGLYNRDWWGADAGEYDWQYQDPETKMRYGSDIDGYSHYQENVPR